MEVEHYIDGEHNGRVFNSGNLNIYGYCYQNPILYEDPNGKHYVTSTAITLTGEFTSSTTIAGKSMGEKAFEPHYCNGVV